MSKVAIPIISCSCDEQKLKKLFHLEHSHIRNDDDFDDDDDAMGHRVFQIMIVDEILHSISSAFPYQK